MVLEEGAVDDIVNTNVKSGIHGLKHAMTAMKDKGVKGSILVNSSMMSPMAESSMAGRGLTFTPPPSLLQTCWCNTPGLRALSTVCACSFLHMLADAH